MNERAAEIEAKKKYKELFEKDIINLKKIEKKYKFSELDKRILKIIIKNMKNRYIRTKKNLIMTLYK